MKSIMYHYVREYDSSKPYSRHKDIYDFENECKYIGSNYKSLNITEAISCSSKYSNNSILLTFDDGFKDHLFVAEILKQFNLKGTFYIPVKPYQSNQILPVHLAHIISSKSGPDSLDLLRRACKRLQIDKTELEDINEKNLYKSRYNEYSDNNAIKEFKRIINYYGSLGLREIILKEIIKDLNLSLDPFEFYLTVEEIKYISSLGFEIGSHGYSHTLLSRLSKKDQLKEIQFSKVFLESILKGNVNSFCFPYGRAGSYNSDTLDSLKICGYKNAVAVASRDIDINDIKYNYYELPRYDCNEINKLYPDL